jgi:hypothetical protein
MRAMSKNAIIEISLVEQSLGKTNEEIKKEIYDEISEGRIIIPWCKEIKKITITE